VVEVEGRLGTRLGGHSPNLGARRRPRNGNRDLAEVLDIAARFG
jgi:hypothetical protein